MRKIISLAICFFLFCGTSYATDTIVYGALGGGDTTFNDGDIVINSTEGLNIVSNGTFDTDLTGWAGANWAQSSGTALHTAGATTALSQAAATVATGSSYELTFTMSGRTVGNVTPSCGAITLTTVSTNSTNTQYFTATNTTALAFTPSTDFDGAIDNVTLKLLTKGSLTVDNGITMNGGQILLNTSNNAAKPSLAFREDIDTGIYMTSVGTLNFGAAGAERFTIDTWRFRAYNTNGPTIENTSGTGTVPTLVPDRSDTDTGIGQYGSDALSLISGGVECMRLTESTTCDNSTYGITSQNGPDAAAVAAARSTKTWLWTGTLAADTDNACGTEADCATLPIPTTIGYVEIWSSGNDYLSAVVVNAGTATVITDSGASVEYQAAIGDCSVLCLFDGGANAGVFNDTAGALTVTIRMVYD